MTCSKHPGSETFIDYKGAIICKTCWHEKIIEIMEINPLNTKHSDLVQILSAGTYEIINWLNESYKKGIKDK